MASAADVEAPRSDVTTAVADGIAPADRSLVGDAFLGTVRGNSSAVAALPVAGQVDPSLADAVRAGRMHANVGIHMSTTETARPRVQGTSREDPIVADPAIVDALKNKKGKAALDYVRQLKRSDPKEHDHLVANIRAGKIDDPKIALPVAIEMASSSAWGKGEGKAQMQLVEKMYAQGRVTFGEVPDDHHARTVPDDPSRTFDKRGTASRIEIDKHLMDSPEATAATIAHEAVHARRFQKGDNPSLLKSEAEGEIAAARVWSGFGKDKYLTNNYDAGLQLEETVKHAGSDEEMRAHVATGYAKNFASWPAADQPEGVRRAVEMLEEARSLDPSFLAKVSNEDVPSLWSAYHSFNEALRDERSPETQESYNALGERLRAMAD